MYLKPVRGKTENGRGRGVGKGGNGEGVKNGIGKREGRRGRVRRLREEGTGRVAPPNPYVAFTSVNCRLEAFLCNK